MMVPLGHACVWCFLPKDGSSDKPDKAPKGKLICQWLLPDEVNIDASNIAAATEVKHSIAKHMSARGSAKPWVDFKDSMQEWTSKLKLA